MQMKIMLNTANIVLDNTFDLPKTSDIDQKIIHNLNEYLLAAFKSDECIFIWKVFNNQESQKTYEIKYLKKSKKYEFYIYFNTQLFENQDFRKIYVEFLIKNLQSFFQEKFSWEFNFQKVLED